MRPKDLACLLDKVISHIHKIESKDCGLKSLEIAFYNFYLSNRSLLTHGCQHSQLAQDLWVAFLLNCWNSSSPTSKSGYFVEFGAIDGVLYSNSILFEKRFGWKGILAEPNPNEWLKCKQNRSCVVENYCVWNVSNESVRFNVVPNAPDHGCMEHFEENDSHKAIRLLKKEVIICRTISLFDLLQLYAAPKTIDYLSVDTEGTEFPILEAFPFEQYAFKIISVEHNFTAMRGQLRHLLHNQGYFPIERSVESFDDLYLNSMYFSTDGRLK